jgi:hypothetical protein
MRSGCASGEASGRRGGEFPRKGHGRKQRPQWGGFGARRRRLAALAQRSSSLGGGRRGGGGGGRGPPQPPRGPILEKIGRGGWAAEGLWGYQGAKGQNLPLCAQLGAARSRQGESKEVGEVVSKRTSSRGKEGHHVCWGGLISRLLTAVVGKRVCTFHKDRQAST